MSNNGLDDNYRNLADAIIKQAAIDYRKSLKRTCKYQRNSSVYLSAREEQRDLERFFRSRWFAQLTNINGEMIIRRLRKEVDEWWKMKNTA